MTTYEYKLVPAGQPLRGRGKTASRREFDEREFAAQINIRALTGWEFVGSEQVVRTRRRLWLLRVTETQPVLVFRRAASPRVAIPREHERALAAAEPAPAPGQGGRAARREDLIAAVRAGSRRVRIAPAGPAGDHASPQGALAGQ